MPSAKPVHSFRGELYLPGHTWELGRTTSAVALSATVKVPSSVLNGNYDLRIALVDSVYGEAAININNERRESADIKTYSRYSIGEIVVQ